MKILKFMGKTTEEMKMCEREMKSWLEHSDMTIKDLLEYKTSKKIYVEKTPAGYFLMCVKDGHEEQIGYGLSKDSAGVEERFLCAGVFLDHANNFKTHFRDDILKSLNE